MFLDEGHALLHGQHVHAVHLDAWDRPAAHGVVQVIARRAVGRGAHAVFVVLDGEHHGEAPQLRHVGGFPDLALVGRSVAVTGDCYRHLLALGRVVFRCEGQSSAHRNLGAHDSLATEKVVFLRIEMHRTPCKANSAKLQLVVKVWLLMIELYLSLWMSPVKIRIIRQKLVQR